MTEKYDPIEEMEFTFIVSRMYSLACDAGMIKDLLKKIRKEEETTGADYPQRIFMAEIHEDELVGEHGEAINAFLMDKINEWDESDSEEPCDVELTF